MDFYTTLKRLLGFPTHDTNQNFPDSPSSRPNLREDSFREDRRERRLDEYERFGFNIFSDPLEMHRYFERQMNEIIKNFGIQGGHDSFFGNFGSGNREPFFDDNSFSSDFPQFPLIEDFQGPTRDQEVGSSLRDQYLKPGYEQARPNSNNKCDKDIDGKFDMGDFDSVLRGVPSQVQPRSFFFGHSMTSKTIQNSDGTIEMHKTVKDQHGNEETTVTRRQGGKEYSITTRTDKDGRQEIVENLVNMTEKDKDAFLKGNRPSGYITDGSERRPPDWSGLYDKFFK